MKLQYPFKLSGKTSELWNEVSNNQWKKMLPKHWTDKGFHFYKRIKERGPEAGINSPGDLESEINKGIVLHHMGDRFKIKLSIINSNGQYFTVFYDFMEKESKCELVTCSYE